MSDDRATALHRIEDLGVGAAQAVFHRLSIDRASALGGSLGRLFGPRLGRIHDRARARLAMALPELGHAAREEALMASWDNLGRTVAEFAHQDALQKGIADGRVALRDSDLLKDLKRSKRPTIFISGHFANWEVLPLALAHAGLKGVAVYRAANNPLVNARILAARRVQRNWSMAPKGKAGAKTVVAALREGLSVCLLADQKMNDGVPAPFFGHTAMTAPAAAQLSLKFRVAVVAGTVERLDGARFAVSGDPPWEPTSTGDRRRDVLALTCRINRYLEAQIRRRPGQWLWQHNRWPTTPEVWAGPVPGLQPSGEPAANSAGSR